MKLVESKLFRIAVYIVAVGIVLQVVFFILVISMHFLTTSSISGITEIRKDMQQTFSYHNPSMDSVLKNTIWYKRFESTSNRDSLLYYIKNARIDADSILNQPRSVPR